MVMTCATLARMNAYFMYFWNCLYNSRLQGLTHSLMHLAPGDREGHACTLPTRKDFFNSGADTVWGPDSSL